MHFFLDRLGHWRSSEQEWVLQLPLWVWMGIFARGFPRRSRPTEKICCWWLFVDNVLGGYYDVNHRIRRHQPQHSTRTHCGEKFFDNIHSFSFTSLYLPDLLSMTLESVQGMFLMTAGCSFFAWITGKITELLTQKSSSQTRFAEEVEELDTFATSRNMPRDLRRHLFQFYKMKYPNERIVDVAVIVSNPQQDCNFQIRKLVLFLAINVWIAAFREFLQEMVNNIESPSLRTDIQLHLFSDLVRNVHLFAVWMKTLSWIRIRTHPNQNYLIMCDSPAIHPLIP